ncbi:CocE/NonD family hydrolase [Nonomuraea sp. NPDC046570]|uniref:CocE/NonD family hydrolase n=1 Tax=Nonomuraea sp. NPDC046570 TaxID=3155255 RepID=UPI0033DB4208
MAAGLAKRQGEAGVGPEHLLYGVLGDALDPVGTQVSRKGHGTLSWLRAQPWFGDQLATWGASYLGYVQWELAARDIPEWKIALIQDAPSSFAEIFMYPGGAFATDNALGWVQLVERMFTGGYGITRQMVGMIGAARQLSRAALALPLQEADQALTGHPVPWFRD